MEKDTQVALKNGVEKTVEVAGKVGKVALAGTLIVGHIALSAIGALLTAMVSQR